MASLNSVTTWDEVVDVLICGFGCAGASAAIEARDTDANVINRKQKNDKIGKKIQT